MAKTALTVNLKVTGVRETLAAFRRMPKAADKELRKQTKALVQTLVPKVKADAMSAPTPQASLAASTVKAASDRAPAISAGGSKRVGRNKKPAWKILFGSEFGSNYLPQFQHPHTGREGLWFFPVVEREADEIVKAWKRVANGIVKSYAGGGR